MKKISVTLLSLGISLIAVLSQPAAGKFQNPHNPGADPYCEFFEGNYYLTTTQGDAIRMWKSPTLGGLKTAMPVTVWKDSDPSRSRSIWAPEFHFITNRWYLYYTATSADGKDANHRLFVLESEGRDPLGPYHYKNRLFNPANDQYAIDATVFMNPGNGLWYCVWAAHPGHVLTIGKLANPWTLEGNCVVIPASGFGCEEVREGPQALQRNGKLFLIYSACDTGKPDYKLGMLIAETNADLINSQSWKQFPTPVLSEAIATGCLGRAIMDFSVRPMAQKTGSFTTQKPTPSTPTKAARLARKNLPGTPTGHQNLANHFHSRHGSTSRPHPRENLPLNNTSKRGSIFKCRAGVPQRTLTHP